MTRDETKTLIAMIMSTYPNFKPSELVNTKLMIDTWYAILEPDNGQDILDAFKVYTRTDTSGFAPTPGKLHMMIADREEPGISEGEILTMLTKASRNATYGFEQSFADLPPLLQRAVGSPTVIRNWGSMESENLSFAFSNVIKVYKEMLRREKENKAAVGMAMYEEPQITAYEVKQIVDEQRSEPTMNDDIHSKLEKLYERLKQ